MATLHTTARADEVAPLIRNNYGSAGLIDMPSARMAPDGELSAGVSYTKNIQHYDFGFQALPWLETSFRYSSLQDFKFDPAATVAYYDRAFGIKARLFNETDTFPAVAVGINDLVGTGIYSGEYIVATKRFGSVDTSLGMGWGRLASAGLFKNPLAILSDHFLTRPGFGTPGGASDVFFRGPQVGLFGGVTWNTPLSGLSLTAEYSSDRYSEETRLGGALNPRTQLNVGAAYQFSEVASLSVNWMYGRTIGANIFFALDPVHDPYPQRLGSEVPLPSVRTDDEQRQAINLLTGASSGRPRPFMHIFSGNAALVDALWQNGSPFSDVSARGDTLALTITRGNAAQACRNAAQLVAHYNASFANISVTDTRGRIGCTSAAAPQLQANDRNIDPGATVLAELVATSSITLIDASAPQVSDAQAITAIRADAAKQQIGIEAIQLNTAEAIVYYVNGHYFAERDALNRLVRLMMADAPPRIEKFRLIAAPDDQPQREFDLLRAPLERNLLQEANLDTARDAAAMAAPIDNPVLAAASRGSYPRFSWSIFPQFRQELFDPVNPFGVQFLAGVSANVELFSGFSISGEAEASLFDTFNTERGSDSLLPHVRTDFLKYFSQGKNGIGNLEADYRFRLAPSVFGVVRAGYLESMFAGIGGQLLWRPEGQRWALGADLFEAQRRSFDRLFGTLPYRVLTGHVSLYYASPFYGLNFVMRAGQYLAGDRGITFEATRRFASGVEIGAFFTRTNVSSQQFGEGSFDKGIIIRIPLGLIAPIDTQSQLGMDLRPVQRDGGQRLLGDDSLFEETRRSSLVEMENISGQVP